MYIGKEGEKWYNWGIKSDLGVCLGVKKIPTLFKVRWTDGGAVDDEVIEGMEWVLRGEGEATEKVDGAACAIIDGALYRRYDANVKKGRKPPLEGIPCQEAADPVTGHWPFWVKVEDSIRSDAHFVRAYVNSPWCRDDGTYEAVGVHFQGNPYGLDDDFLEPHGRIKIRDLTRTYEGICDWLEKHEVEGIVFWKDGEPKCKIKRKNFGFEWPVKGESE